MTTITQMERTDMGWKCPRCGETREDDLLPVRTVECTCTGLDAFRHGPIVTLTAEQLRKRYTTVDEEEFHETGQDGTRVLRRRLVTR